jgi:uncharacterized cupredoxin-like copper-binding protein
MGLILVAGCGADMNDAAPSDNNVVSDVIVASNDVTGSVQEWQVDVDSTVARSGDVTFTIDNDGTVGHEFLIVKTDIPPGEIPTAGDHFPEDAEGIEVIDEIGEFAVGTTESLTVTLARGSYQLVCNLPEHYENGMFVGFDVVT